MKTPIKRLRELCGYALSEARYAKARSEYGRRLPCVFVNFNSAMDTRVLDRMTEHGFHPTARTNYYVLFELDPALLENFVDLLTVEFVALKVLLGP